MTLWYPCFAMKKNPVLLMHAFLGVSGPCLGRDIGLVAFITMLGLKMLINMSAVLDSHTHSILTIRNIQIVRQNLFPLIAEINKDKHWHLPSATINAFGADLLDSSDQGTDFCIFSSWLAVLADRKVSEKD